MLELCVYFDEYGCLGKCCYLFYWMEGEEFYVILVVNFKGGSGKIIMVLYLV